MSKENKEIKKNKVETYFYKREVKIWKQDIVSVMELGIKGFAVQTLAMDLIIEKQLQLTMKQLAREAGIFRDKNGVSELTQEDCELVIDTYEDFYITDEGFIMSKTINSALGKDAEYTKRARKGGYITGIKKKLKAGHDWNRICESYGIDINSILHLKSDNEKTSHIVDVLNNI
tara:strand:- start:191 stop:712 length:522 start_codon:yes stop_codon:yes gene_type:complete